MLQFLHLFPPWSRLDNRQHLPRGPVHRHVCVFPCVGRPRRGTDSWWLDFHHREHSPHTCQACAADRHIRRSPDPVDALESSPRRRPVQSPSRWDRRLRHLAYEPWTLHRRQHERLLAEYRDRSRSTSSHLPLHRLPTYQSTARTGTKLPNSVHFWHPKGWLLKCFQYTQNTEPRRPHMCVYFALLLEIFTSDKK